jgi:hypothetical protein
VHFELQHALQHLSNEQLVFPYRPRDDLQAEPRHAAEAQNASDASFVDVDDDADETGLSPAATARGHIDPQLLVHGRFCASRPDPKDVTLVDPFAPSFTTSRASAFRKRKTDGAAGVGRVSDDRAGASLHASMRLALPPYFAASGLEVPSGERRRGGDVLVLYDVAGIPQALIRSMMDDVAGVLKCADPCRVSAAPEDRAAAHGVVLSPTQHSAMLAATVMTSAPSAELVRVLYHTQPPSRVKDLIGSFEFMQGMDVVASVVAGADVYLPTHSQSVTQALLARKLPSMDDEVRKIVEEDLQLQRAEFDVSRLFCSVGAKSEKDALAAVFLDNCHSDNGRETLLSQLMEFLSVHSYGRCMHTKDLVDPRGTGSSAAAAAVDAAPGAPSSFFASQVGRNGSAAHIDLISRYKFFLAFEYSNLTDWVTDQVFEALMAGTVPVYYGPINIEEYVPYKSVIQVRDFPTVKELAMYLIYLDQHPAEYAKYLSWKTSAVWPDTLKLHTSRRHALCGICSLAHARLAEKRLARLDPNAAPERPATVWDSEFRAWMPVDAPSE